MPTNTRWPGFAGLNTYDPVLQRDLRALGEYLTSLGAKVADLQGEPGTPASTTPTVAGDFAGPTYTVGTTSAEGSLSTILRSDVQFALDLSIRLRGPVSIVGTRRGAMN